ncbi:entericidin EcnAB [Sulfurovum sp. XTW-4]|uniref:Entericidin EcnAB n=1 Tax=Sulfurovum xiamenensis TaxID=3019066 RepID=A0ABT7QRG3_9BACT|nr:entericidin EcnAB [Sulfurovum xiamenensis]MDM5263474.1 entericidin EcnAB [Sulfurovum xiamenensis]
MKKITIIALLMSLGMIMSGCSKTWNGIKQDTGEAWDASKKAVHKATA